MRAIFYILSAEDESLMEGQEAFPTKRQALEAAKGFDVPVTITRVETGGLALRELLSSVFNRRGYAVRSDEVYSSEPPQETE